MCWMSLQSAEFCYLLPDWFLDMISPCVLKVVKILHERVWWHRRACEIGHDSPLVLDICEHAKQPCEKLKMISHHVLHYGFSTKLSLVVSMLCHSDTKKNQHCSLGCRNTFPFGRISGLRHVNRTIRYHWKKLHVMTGHVLLHQLFPSCSFLH